MNWRYVFRVVVTMLAIVISYFSPWITDNYARHAAITGFNQAWENTTDGCGTDKALQSVKAPFGRKIDIEYGCGLLPSDSPDYRQKTEVFVSFLGTVHIDKAARPKH